MDGWKFKVCDLAGNELADVTEHAELTDKGVVFSLPADGTYLLLKEGETVDPDATYTQIITGKELT